MPLLSYDITLYHIFFLLLFLNYFLRGIVLERIDKIFDNEDYAFGESLKETKKFF